MMMNTRKFHPRRNQLLQLLLLAAATLVIATSSAQAADSGWTWTASAGVGYDSNVYLSPKTPYIDLGQAGNPLVVPKVQSGLFIPLGLEADFKQKSGMVFNYTFDGEIYASSALRNANMYDHNAKLGWNQTLESGWLQGAKLYTGLLAGYHKQIYFDRDTGAAKLSSVSGTNISNRYTHYDIGGEAKLQQEIDDIEYTLRTKLANQLYQDPIVMAPLDHILFEAGGDARIPLGSKSSKLKLGYDFKVEDYASRSARDAAGVQSAANGLLTYYYHTLNAQLFQKFNRSFMAFVDYYRTYRIDSFVNYNGYTKDRVKLRLRYHLDNFLLRGSVAYSHKNYPNAFAFDNPVAGRKTYNKLDASLKCEYESFLSGLGEIVFWAKADYVKQNSSDLRYVYNRTQSMVGGDWKF